METVPFALLTSSILMLSAPVAYAEQVINGTNLTVFSPAASIRYTFNGVTPTGTTDVVELGIGGPLNARQNMSLQLNIPYETGSDDTGRDIGDISLDFTHMVDVNADRGLVYSAELFFDTAGGEALGAGQNVLEFSAYYAKFLASGGILTPSVVQTLGLSDTTDVADGINQTTIDIHYAPMMGNSQYFMSLEPAVTRDWVAEETYGSLVINLAMVTGHLAGGTGKVYVKPGVLFGADRPVDYSFELGFQVLNF